MKVLLVDDETPARVRLRKLLTAIPGIEVIGEATHGLQALEEIEAKKPDLVFLDIEMPELDGIGVARTLGMDGPAIVFVTAYDEFALKAFDVHAIDYLVKPVASERLKTAVEKVRTRSRPGDLGSFLGEVGKAQGITKLAVKTGNKYVVAELVRASAILAKDHYSAILIDGRELLADESLDALETKLDPQKFLRAHRGGIVNIDFVKEVEREGDRKFVIILTDLGKTRVPIARDRLDEVRGRLKF